MKNPPAHTEETSRSMPYAPSRRETLFTIAGGAIAAALPRFTRAAPARQTPPNILLITADDMNYDSLGVTGCKTPGMTPNLDRLASQGILFKRAHVTVAVCQPCRSVLMTGRYPHRNGAMGFEPIARRTPTLQEHLQKAGYRNGILGKVEHLQPEHRFCWDFVTRYEELGNGRDPSLYYQSARDFFASSKASGKPFFCMANSHDPHRPFAGSAIERKRNERADEGSRFPQAGKYYKPEEIEVPGFLPDLPDVRQEVAEYYSSVHRCDRTVGAVLRALHETGQEENTLVMFLSDHGMAFPFAKTNCYLHSTHTPWIVRWPGRITPGMVDEEHFISGIDFMPTVLEACGVELWKTVDGRSFLPLLSGESQTGRESVYTVFHNTSAQRYYPMRCVQNARFGYIFNPWADGEKVFKNESQSGLTFNAMKAAGGNDPAIAARVELFVHRVPEEFYDLSRDPDARHNRIDDPRYQEDIRGLQRQMLAIMKTVDDPQLGAFRRQIGK